MRHVPLEYLRANLLAQTHAGAPSAQAYGIEQASALPQSTTRPLWVQLSGSRQTLDGNNNVSQLKQSSTDIFIGGDYDLAQGWRAGAALSYSDSRLRVDKLASKTDIDSYSLALYGGQAFATNAGKLNLLLGSAYTWHTVDSTRRISVAGLDQTLSADYRANTTQLFTELGYAMSISDATRLEPFMGLDWNSLRTRGFTESGGNAALTVKRKTNDLTYSTLGLPAHTALNFGQTDINLQGTLGWRHAFGDVDPRSTHAFHGGKAFTVAGTPIAQNAAIVEVGADVAVSLNLSMGLSYEGQYGSGNRDHTGNISMRWRF